MKLSDVIALIGAGYSKEEIEKMETAEPETGTTTEQAPQTNNSDTGKPDAGKQDTGNMDATATALVEAAKALTDAVRAANFSAVKQNTPVNTQEEADKILLNFCNT